MVTIMYKREVYLANLEQTQIIASKLAKIVSPNDVITLSGNLGAGKTTFIQYFIKNLSTEEIEITSPTFNLLHIYKLLNLEIWHFDLYRLKTPDEVYELGIESAFVQGLSIIEWPEIIQDILPKDRLELNLSFSFKDDARILTMKGCGRWASILREQLLL